MDLVMLLNPSCIAFTPMAMKMIQATLKMIFPVLLISMNYSLGFSQAKEIRIYNSNHLYELANGGEMDFQQYKNKVILVHLWASWCAACIEDHPKVVSLQESINHKDLEVIYVSMDRDKADMKACIDERDWEGTYILMQQNLGNPLSKMLYYKETKMEDGRTKYQTGVPNYFLINREGNGYKTYDIDDPRLKEEIQKLLAAH